jgi:uncharacterized protein (DUF1499 family)
MTHSPFPLDFAALIPDARPRRWLILPPGFESAAEPDAVSPVFACTPAALLSAVDAVALGEERTVRMRDGEGQAEYVQRSKVFKFPDRITVEALAAGDGAALAAYSRAQVGRYDFKVNQRRLERWIAALHSKLG